MHPVDLFRLVEPRQREAGDPRDGHLFEGMIFVLNIDVLAW